MKNVAKGFAKASFIYSKVSMIIALVALGIVTTANLISIGTVIAEQGPLSSAVIGAIFKYSYYHFVFGSWLVGAILGMNFSDRLAKTLENATTKDEIIAPAVLVIIFGFTPSGIIALTVPPSEFSKKEEKPEEVTGEVVD